MYIEHTSYTKTGSGRDKNEDWFEVYQIEQSALPERASGNCAMVFCIADGMGGHPYGEVASRMACESLKKLLTQKKFSCSDLQTRLKTHYLTVDQKLRAVAEHNPQYRHMGTPYPR